MKPKRVSKGISVASAGRSGTTKKPSDYAETQEALRESEEKFKSLSEKSIVGVYLHQDGRIKYANAKVAEIMEYPLDEIVDRLRVEDFVFPEDLPLVVKNIRKKISGERESLHYEVRILTKNRNLKYVEIYSARTLYRGRPAVVGMMMDITQRKKMAAALEASEKRFRQLADATFEGIVIHDQYRILDVNQSALQLSGYTYEEAIGRNLVDIVAPDAKKMVLQRLQSGPARPMEVPMIRKDGEQLMIEIIEKPIVYNGRQVRVVALRDITERRRMEESLRESRKRYELITDNMTENMCLMGIDFKVVWISPSVVRELGYSLEEIKTVPRDKLLTAESLKAVTRMAKDEFPQKILDRKGPASPIILEMEVVRKDGSSFWSEVSFTLLHGMQEEPIGILAVGRDITRRRQAEQDLKFSLEISFKAFHSSPTPMIITTFEEGRFIDVNESFLRIMGYRRDELLGRSTVELHLWANPARRGSFIRKLTKSGFIQGEYTQLQSRTGQMRDVLASCAVYALKEQRYALFMFYDITEQKKLEEQLRRSQKMEAIGTLTGGIAHDFNNILGGIMGYTELAMDHHIGPEHPARHLLMGALRGIKRAKDLVAQMMLFSRRQEQKKIPLDMVPIVKEALKLLRASIPATIKINTHIDAGKCPVLADPTQIHQVLMNLVTNAAHAMKGKKGLIDVSLKPIRFPKGDPLPHTDLKQGVEYQVLTVADTGHGIDPQNLSRIFDPFFTTKKAGEGTGLGLSVVYGIIKSYEGVVGVESEPGKGTTFRVYIPAKAAGTAQEPPDKVNIRGGPERILFVDDEYALTEIFDIYLRDLGYTVVALNDPLQALEDFKKNPDDFDLVITDLTMPDMTGLDLAYEMIRIRPDIPVMLCSGSIENLHPDELTKRGVRQVEIKPLSINHLAASIRRILDEG